MDDIIKEIYLHCDLTDICNLYIVNKQWYNVSKIYKQSISKSILNKNGYYNFNFEDKFSRTVDKSSCTKKHELKHELNSLSRNYNHSNYHHILKTFINYDPTFQKNIINTYFDGKYNLCYFIIINDNFNDVAEKAIKEHFRDYDIEFLVESILDYYFLVRQRSKLNNKSLLIYLIKWKIKQLNNIYTDNNNYLSNFYLLELHGFLNKRFKHYYNNHINYWLDNTVNNKGTTVKYRYKHIPLDFLHKYNIKQNLIMYLEDD